MKKTSPRGVQRCSIVTMTSRGLNALGPAGLLLAGSMGLQLTDTVAAPARQDARPTASVSVRNDVMAVLSKAGCNSGPCHGNRNGKGGFKLSLRGEDPDADYAAMVHAVGGRRVNFINPEEGLLL